MITYCTNIHPGESWAEHFAELRRWLPAVKARVSPHRPFPVGLRLSAQAAKDLAAPERLAEFADFLAAHDLFVPTLNGFPFGAFHDRPVKERVYRPDWREPARLTYTRQLAKLLAGLLPEGVQGSISTVPGAYASDLRHREDADAVAAGLVRMAAELHELRERTGRMIVLALEPEPGCLLETIDEACAFFRERLFGLRAIAQMKALTGLAAAEAEAALRRHLGLCLDACHLSVAFDSPLHAIARLEAEGITIAKMQVSAGLVLPSPHGALRRQLAELADPVWLHQVRIRNRIGVRRYADLPDALMRDFAAGTEWRVHLHVPVWCETFGPFGTTAFDTCQLLARQAVEPFTELLEVETYGWGLLPPELSGGDLAASLAREIEWTRESLGMSAVVA